MFDSLFSSIAWLLNFFYGITSDYAISIALLTCVLMVITTPLTLKGTRSMIEMQRLQPEIRRLQTQYKDDRQKLNEEMMRFYREHEINPIGGCLPMLIQMPVFSILYWVVRGLTNNATFVGLQGSLANFGIEPNVTSGFSPKYLDHSSDLYKSLSGDSQMLSFGVDLAISPSQALGEGVLTALPYILALVIIGGLAWYQQKQIMGRNSGAEVTQQQQMMMRLGPVLQVGFTFISPMAIGIYFLVSTAWRVAQQTYITHSLYKGEDSLGVQAQRAMAEARAERKKQQGGGKAGGNGARTTKPSGAKPGTNRKTSSNGSSSARPGNAETRAAETSGTPAGSGTARPHPRSRKKKKRK